jgi:hypothetical protein
VRKRDRLLTCGEMNLEQLQQKLVAVARALPPSDAVPYRFEQRIMARLAAGPAPDLWALWSRLLWRAAAPCVGVMVALSVWTVVANHRSSSQELLAADLDRTVWGPLTSMEDSW